MEDKLNKINAIIELRKAVIERDDSAHHPRKEYEAFCNFFKYASEKTGDKRFLDNIKIWKEACGEIPEELTIEQKLEL